MSTSAEKPKQKLVFPHCLQTFVVVTLLSTTTNRNKQTTTTTVIITVATLIAPFVIVLSSNGSMKQMNPMLHTHKQRHINLNASMYC